jgi:VWFA-related protein
MSAMRNTAKFLTAGAFALLLAMGSASRPNAQAQRPAAPPPPAPAQPSAQQPTFRVSVDLITTDLIARDAKSDQFIADLKPEEIEIYEDGVKQQIVSLTLTHGGRVYNQLAPPAAPPQEGIILPRNRPTNDAAGRIFLIFIDDLHLQFRETPRTRDLIKRMLRNLIHDGDMFGIVSTGHSSISEQLTYDRQILESAIDRIAGGGLTPQEIMQGQSGSQGPTELRHRAHVAFSTGYELMKNLEKVQNRRKAVIYISSGYDFDPFVEGRLEEQARRMGISLGNSGSDSGDGNGGPTLEDLRTDPFYMNQRASQQLSAGDLIRELAELTRAANRANATIYTIDPRGLIAGPDIDVEVNMQDWMAFVRQSQDSLRVLAEETGGIAVVNQNDFDKALKRIDNETSDYYVLGYYSTNPDPMRRTRRIEIRTTRQNVNVRGRESYTLRPLPPPANN